MTLNFPVDKSQPYIDPSSGLKYIYNNAVGGWETAIQPPCIISDAAPVFDVPGFLWWDNENGNMYVRYKDADTIQWVQTTASGARYLTQPSPNPPFNARVGDVWIDISDETKPQMYLRVGGDGTPRWQSLERQLVQNPYGGPKIKVSPTEPIDANIADVYYNTTTKQLNIYTENGWVHPERETSNFIREIIVGEGLSVTSGHSPRISLDEATTKTIGTIRLANQVEVNNKVSDTTVITPASLRQGIRNYLPGATQLSSGVIRLATDEEVMDGTNNSAAVTPASIHKIVVPALPTGASCDWHGSLAPTGFLICDGQVVSRRDYPDLYNIIGIKYGSGDGGKTFNLPTSTGGIKQIIKY